MNIDIELILTIVVGLAISIVQWSLKRNINELDTKNKEQDKRADYIETGMEKNREDLKVNAKADEIMQQWIEKQNNQQHIFFERMFDTVKEVMSVQLKSLQEQINRLENEQKKNGR